MQFLIYNVVPQQCLSSPGHPMWHKETQGFSWFHNCWDRPSGPFQSTVQHSPCLYDIHTSGPGRRRAVQKQTTQTEWPDSSTGRPGRSPPKSKDMCKFISIGVTHCRKFKMTDRLIYWQGQIMFGLCQYYQSLTFLSTYYTKYFTFCKMYKKKVKSSVLRSVKGFDVSFEC